MVVTASSAYSFHIITRSEFFTSRSVSKSYPSYARKFTLIIIHRNKFPQSSIYQSLSKIGEPQVLLVTERDNLQGTN